MEPVFWCLRLRRQVVVLAAQLAHVATWMSWLIVTLIRAGSLAAPHAPAGQELRHPGLSQEATLNTTGDA